MRKNLVFSTAVVFLSIVSSPSSSSSLNHYLASVVDAQSIDSTDLSTTNPGNESLSYPAYTLEPLNFSLSYRQNVCQRQEAFHNGSVTLMDALEGMELHVYFLEGIENFSPTSDDGSIAFDTKEPVVNILDELALRAKFRWRESYGASHLQDALTEDDIDPWRNKSNSVVSRQSTASLDDIVNWAALSFDLVGNEFSKTLIRVTNGTFFAEGHVDASIIMIGKSDREASGLDLFAFLEPFDWEVWILTGFTMIIAGFIYQWMEWINQDSDRQDLANKPTETIYFAALSFNGDIKFEPSTNYARAFVLTLAFWGLILSSAYTANLASFLVVQNTPVLQVETIGDAVAASLPMCVVQGSAAESIVREEYPQAILIAMPAENPNDIFLGVLRDRCALAITPIFQWDIAKRNRTINVDCQLQWIGRTFRFVKSGFSTRSDSGTLCTNLIRDVISLHIGIMLDDGTIDKIQRDYFRSQQTIDCRAAKPASTLISSSDGVDEEDGIDDTDGIQSVVQSASLNDSGDIQSLSLQDLGGLFIIIYCVGAVCCLAATITWYRKRQERQQSNRSMKIQQNNDLELKEEETSDDNNHDDTAWTLKMKDTVNGNDGSTGIYQNERDILARKVDRMRRELDDMQSMLLGLDQ